MSDVSLGTRPRDSQVAGEDVKKLLSENVKNRRKLCNATILKSLMSIAIISLLVLGRFFVWIFLKEAEWHMYHS